MEKYSSPVAYGSKYLFCFEDDLRYVQEKVDGSQFSFMMSQEGELKFRSRGGIIDPAEPQKMFRPAVEFVLGLDKEKIIPEAIYRGEAVGSKRHNKMTYGRAAEGFVLFDVEKEGFEYLTPERVMDEAGHLGLDFAPIYRELEPGRTYTEDLFQEDCKNESVLGGKIEGVVIKNYNKRFSDSGGLMVAKWVTPEFREVMTKTRIVKQYDTILSKLVEKYKTEARYHKALQHLREAGEIEDSMKDVGKLLKELSIDFERECKEVIKDELYDYYRKPLVNGVKNDLPNWYRKELGIKG